MRKLSWPLIGLGAAATLAAFAMMRTACQTWDPAPGIKTAETTCSHAHVVAALALGIAAVIATTAGFRSLTSTTDLIPRWNNGRVGKP